MTEKSGASGLTAVPHRRCNALTGEWVLVSPHRLQRPWQGRVEQRAPAVRSRYDSGCYLCPGNQRAGGKSNPDYSSCYVFTNDFPALLPDSPALSDASADPLHAHEAVRGTSRVVCFSPRHDLTLAEMSPAEIRAVVDVWAEQTQELGRDYAWVQVFENKGELMGCSNPHPHGQIWALDAVPSEPAKEIATQRAYFERTGRQLLLDYAKTEENGERIVEANAHWLAVVPYWAEWPFETLIMPRRHVLRMPDLKDDERAALAELLGRLLATYDNLFATSFPYSMGWHGAPFGASDWSCWQLHAHVFPPLLRSATVKKFMVGYEMLGEPQRDLTPEQAAQMLRDAQA